PCVAQALRQMAGRPRYGGFYWRETGALSSSGLPPAARYCHADTKRPGRGQCFSTTQTSPVLSLFFFIFFLGGLDSGLTGRRAGRPLRNVKFLTILGGAMSETWQ